MTVVPEQPLSSNTITFTQAGGQTVYFKIPKDSTSLEAKLNISGYYHPTIIRSDITVDAENSYAYNNYDAWGDSPDDRIEYTVDENFDTYSFCQACVIGTGDAWIEETFNIGSNSLGDYDVYQWIAKFNDVVSGDKVEIQVKKDSGSYNLVINGPINGQQIYSIGSENFAGSTVTFKTRIYRDGTSYNARLYYEGKIYAYNYFYPTNPYLEVGIADGIHEWSYSGQYNLQNQLTNDFSDEVNTFLSQCTPDLEGYCNVPLIFHSDSPGILNISMIYKECVNGQEKCVNYNYYLCENGLWQDKGQVPGKCGIVPCSTSIDCPKSSCPGKYYSCEVGVCVEHGQCIESPKSTNLWDLIQQVWESFWNWVKGLFS